MLLWAFCPGGGRFALALYLQVLPGCARSMCVVACCVPVLWCVLCVARCCVACLCWAWFLLCAAAPCCRCLVPCRGPWLCSVLGCGAVLLWCAACRAVWWCLRRVLLVVPCCFVRAGWCCVLLPVVAGCFLLGLVACCCFPLACAVAVAPGWPRGLLPCCVLWFVVVPLPCAVSCVLWCCVAVWCCAVAPCGPFSFAGGVGLCRFPVCAVLCCAARRVVRRRFGLRCCWCLVLWCVAVCCGVSLRVVWCGGAALVCRGVLLCCAVFCGAVSPCGAVLLGCCVCFAFLGVFLLPLKTIFRFLKIKIKQNKNEIILYPTHACRQAARPSPAYCLTCNPAASTLTASSLSSFVVFPPFDLHREGGRKRQGWGRDGKGGYMEKTRKGEGARRRAWRVRKMFFRFYALLAKRFSLPIRRVRGRQARRCTPKFGSCLQR